MSLRSVVLSVVTAAYAARGVTLVLNAVVMPRLRPASRGSTRLRPASRGSTRLRPAPRRSPQPHVSILVPARDEADVLPGLLADLSRQGADEVIVFDDGLNADGLRDAAALGVEVISSERPDGWSGKNWACHELARAATGDLLVFTDADTIWEVGALDAALSMRDRLDADLLSVLPSVRELTWATRMLSPLVENIVLTLVPWPLLAWDRLGLGAASGAMIAISRRRYDAVGGHAAFAHLLQDDMELARRTQRSVVGGRRGRSRLVLGDALFGAVFYANYRDSVEGFAKSVVAIHEGSRLAPVVSVAAFALTHTVPWFLAPSPWVWWVRAGSILDRTLSAVVAGRRRPADLAEGLLGPVTPLAAVPVLAAALRPMQRWKGRSYGQEATRGSRSGCAFAHIGMALLADAQDVGGVVRRQAGPDPAENL